MRVVRNADPGHEARATTAPAAATPGSQRATARGAAPSREPQIESSTFAGAPAQRLVSLLVARDGAAEEALDALYQRHSPAVYSYLVQLLGKGERAEAALVDTFMRLWARPSSAPRQDALLGRWLLLQANVLAQAELQSGEASAQDTAPPGVARLEDVLITPELARRPARSPDLQAENDALFALARQLATRADPDAVLAKLVHTAVDLCGAGTAGISLLETPEPEGEMVFRWTHMAGHLEEAVGGTTPRAFSPCGVTLDRAAPQLFSHPARLFTYFAEVPVPIVEGLVVPLSASDGPAAEPIGTIWIVSHDDRRRFDWEDARIMSSLASFTAIALQIATAGGGGAGRRAAPRAGGDSLSGRAGAPPE